MYDYKKNKPENVPSSGNFRMTRRKIILGKKIPVHRTYGGLPIFPFNSFFNLCRERLHSLSLYFFPLKRITKFFFFETQLILMQQRELGDSHRDFTIYKTLFCQKISSKVLISRNPIKGNKLKVK